MIRTFIAAEIPPGIQDKLETIAINLRSAGAKAVRWVAPRNIHITLKFLGDIPENKVDIITKGLKEVTVGFPAFAVKISGLGAFPNQFKPRVVWVGLSSEVHLIEIQQKVEQRLELLGFAKEARPFSAHLTLGRVSQNASPAEVSAISVALRRIQVNQVGDAWIDRLVLFRSDLNPGGSIYTPLSHFPFS